MWRSGNMAATSTASLHNRLVARSHIPYMICDVLAKFLLTVQRDPRQNHRIWFSVFFLFLLASFCSFDTFMGEKHFYGFENDLKTIDGPVATKFRIKNSVIIFFFWQLRFLSQSGELPND